jgi:hypothetical protein
MARAYVTAVVAALLLAAVPPASGKITESTVDKDDRAIVLLVRPFGFEADGEWWAQLQCECNTV